MAPSLRRKLRQIARTGIRTAEERTRQLLDERTEYLAAREDYEANAPVEAPQVLICGAGRELFGIPAAAVAEVLPSRETMPTLGGSPALVGVLGRGGRLVSVIDLALALGMTASSEEGAEHLVLLRNEQPLVALRVGRAYAVSEIAPLTEGDEVSFRSDAVTGYAKALSGFADQNRVLSLLDIERLLRPFQPSSTVPGV